MKKTIGCALCAMAMFTQAPVAFAGYWTGHVEVIKDTIEDILSGKPSASDDAGAVRNEGGEASADRHAGDRVSLRR